MPVSTDARVRTSAAGRVFARSSEPRSRKGATIMIGACEAVSVRRLKVVTVVFAVLGLGIPTTTAQAQKHYQFTTVAFLGDPAPGGGFFGFDFEPRGINSRGEVAFHADVTTGGEGVFLATK